MKNGQKVETAVSKGDKRPTSTRSHGPVVCQRRSPPPRESPPPGSRTAARNSQRDKRWRAAGTPRTAGEEAEVARLRGNQSGGPPETNPKPPQDHWLQLVSTQEKRTRTSKPVSLVLSSITRNTRKTEANCGLAIRCNTKRNREHHRHSRHEPGSCLKCGPWMAGPENEKLAPFHRAYFIYYYRVHI